MKKVYFAIGYQPVENFIMKQMEGKIDVVGTTVYRESILPAVLEKEPDILITRETLPGSMDFLEIIDKIRVECHKDVQIIFITGGRQPGDAFLSALVRYGVYDLVVGDNIKMQEVCRMIEHPNKYRDVFMYSPKVKIDEKTKKEIFEAPTAPKIVEKEVIKEVIIDRTTIDDANSSKVSLEELQKIEEQKRQIEEEQENLLKMKVVLEQEKLALEESKIQMNKDYEFRRAEFEEEMILRLRSIEEDRDRLIKEEQEKLKAQMERDKAEIQRLKEEANKALDNELKQIHKLKQQEVESKMKALEEENERKIKALKDEANHKYMEEQEKYNSLKLEEIEKFQEDKKKLERKYASLREEQDRQSKLIKEQEKQMQYQRELLKQEQKKLQEQKEKELRSISEAKKQLEEEKKKLKEEAEIRIKEEREKLELLLKEKESKLNVERDRLKNDYDSLNDNISSRLEAEKSKIQKDANQQFAKYKQDLKATMLKKLEQERNNILSSSEEDKSKLEQQFKVQQEKLQLEYKKELEEKMNALKAETSEKFKLEQKKIEEYRKEEEIRLKNKKSELDEEKKKFEEHKDLEIKNLEAEKKRLESEFKELEEQMKSELKRKELELIEDRKLMEEKQIQLKEEMDKFIKAEQERLNAINQETLDKERENLRIQEELMQQELDSEKNRLIKERQIIEDSLREQKILMEKEKRELELIKAEQEKMLKAKELEINEIMNSKKQHLLQIQQEEEAKIQEKMRLMKEEEERIAKREELLKQQEDANKNLKNLAGEKKVLTFLGCKSGVGTSTIAFNTAIALANKKKKVLYLELNHNFSTIGYIYKLNFYDIGIDVALKQIQSNDYENLSKNIISLKDVLANTDKNDLMQYNYKKMPQNLDYMFYSAKYYSEEREILDDYFKEFLMHLLTRYGYDYIIFDLNIKDVKYLDDTCELDSISQTVLQFSSKVYFTITQDVSAVGSCIQYRKILMKAKIPVNEFKFILNRYESKSMLDKKGLEEWLKVEFDLVLADKHKECINSNYIGLPLIINSRDRDIAKAFNSIVQDILSSKSKKR